MLYFSPSTMKYFNKSLYSKYKDGCKYYLGNRNDFEK